AVGIGLAILAAACATSERLPRPRKTHLTVMPLTLQRGSSVLADDAKTWAFVVSEVGKQRVHYPGGTGPVFRTAKHLEFSPRTPRLFYWATEETDGPSMLVADGTIVMRHLAREGALVFSKDGSRWAAVAHEIEKGEERGPAVIVVDGAEQERSLDASLPAFSPDG